MANPGTKRSRISYWFDNFMSRGLWAKIGFLALVTIVFILIMGAIAMFAYGDTSQMLPWVWWKTIMTSLGKNTPGQTDGPPIYVALMIVAMIYGMFFSSMLIGFIAGSIRDKVNSLAKGAGNVIESDHIIILGFNETTFVLLEELIEADRNLTKPQVIVVLDEAKKETMDDQIASRFGRQKDHPKTRIVCRTGPIYDLASLRRCSIDTCRSIIVGADEDFETVKAIMACTYLLNNEESFAKAFAVAVIHEEDSVDAAEIAGRDGREGDRLELLPLQEILARIIVHTSRQPGLSKVFVELFNFRGNEFYTVSSKMIPKGLVGSTLREINLYLKDTIAVGVYDEKHGIVLDNPNRVTLEKGQSLIVVAEDDSGIRLASKPAEPQKQETNLERTLAPVHCLIFGVEPILNDMLIEYARYLQRGSTITVVAEESRTHRHIRAASRAALEREGIELDVRAVEELARDEVFAVCDEIKPDSVVILNNHASSDPDGEDAAAIALMLYLREYRDLNGATFGITSEMFLGKNQKIAAAAGSDDYIIAKHLSGLLMSQIALDRRMKDFFECLLSAEGFEVYMKPACNYVEPDRDVDLFSVIDAVAERGELLIGIQQRTGTRFEEPQINPAKYSHGAIKQYRFGPYDRLVLLSEGTVEEDGEIEAAEASATAEAAEAAEAVEPSGFVEEPMIEEAKASYPEELEAEAEVVYEVPEPEATETEKPSIYACLIDDVEDGDFVDEEFFTFDADEFEPQEPQEASWTPFSASGDSYSTFSEEGVTGAYSARRTDWKTRLSGIEPAKIAGALGAIAALGIATLLGATILRQKKHPRKRRLLLPPGQSK